MVRALAAAAHNFDLVPDVRSNEPYRDIREAVSRRSTELVLPEAAIAGAEPEPEPVAVSATEADAVAEHEAESPGETSAAAGPDADVSRERPRQRQADRPDAPRATRRAKTTAR